MSQHSISRRKFFLGAALAGAIPAGGFGSVTSLKRLGYKSPNEKLNIAAIGAGGKGYVDITNCKDENITAFADPDEKRAAKTFAQFPAVPRYADFRQMLDKAGSRIDAVTVSTPRPYAWNGGDVGDRARQTRLLSEAADAHGLGGAALDGGGAQSTMSRHRWAIRDIRAKGRGSAAR